MAKFIGQTGLVYLWGKIKNYVSNYVKITSSTGKDTITAGNNSIDVYDWAQASTKPSYTLDEVSDGTTNKHFTSTEKTKLGNIASGAEVNQNAFSNVKVGSTTIAADGKTDTLEIAGGGDVTVTPDATNDKVTISVTTPKNTSDLTNDSGFITISDVPEGAAASTTTPKMDGTAAVGTETAFARGDHRHPTDTSRQAVINDLSDIRSGAAAGATAYQLPSGGIPKTDLASAVQTSLGKADTAMQSGDLPVATSTTPKMDGTAAVGSENKWAKGDHVHPSDTSKVDKTTTVNGHALSGNVTVTKSDVSLGNVTNDAQVKRTEMGAANGVATLDSTGKVPSSQLPSYVDDVIESYARSGQTALTQNWLATGSASGAVITPEAGKIYVLMADAGDYAANTQFRWGGTAYVKLNDGGISEMTTAEMDTATDNWA